jgi:AcrR family transcriptional regulator
MSEDSRANQRKQRILAAAEELFCHYGYAKTTVADIARAAGIAVGAVYLEFPAKETIAAALSQLNHGRILDAMRRARHAPGSCGERLRAMLEARVRGLMHVIERGQHGYDLVRCGCAAAEQAHRHFRQAQAELLAELLAEAGAAGEFTPGDPLSTADLLLRIYDSLGPDPRNPTGARQLRRQLTALHQLVLLGLLTRPL